MASTAARRWLEQAGSDLRVARALWRRPEPLLEGDAGCHLAALCSQAIEKSIKGYLVLNRTEFAMGHRPDRYLLLLCQPRTVRHAAHLPHLSRLFTLERRQAIRELLELTPGALGVRRLDLPNTEYPWQVQGEWALIPAGHPIFADPARCEQWLKLARQVVDGLARLVSLSELTEQT
ncbi:MAG: hypothetical protein IT204_12565 [Fimbriimonadaceae bacterium]|nr:hypothetical protein [Fimbriimonadaceae bacterium]